MGVKKNDIEISVTPWCDLKKRFLQYFCLLKHIYRFRTMLLLLKYAVECITLSLSLYYAMKCIYFNNLIYLLRHAIQTSRLNLHVSFASHYVFELHLI